MEKEIHKKMKMFLVGMVLGRGARALIESLQSGKSNCEKRNSPENMEVVHGT